LVWIFKPCILFLGDYYLDIIFYNRADVIDWLGTIRYYGILYVINLFFDFLTVVVTVKTLQKILESEFLVQIFLIICNVIIAYILMLIEYYVVLFYMFSLGVTNLELGLLLFKGGYAEFNEAFGNPGYLALFLHIIKHPIFYIISAHEILNIVLENTDPQNNAKDISHLAMFTAGVFYSSTTLIPIALYLSILFFSVISKLILEPIRSMLSYMLKSISAQEGYPIFVALGFFFVILSNF
jgi:hypothetical protein